MSTLCYITGKWLGKSYMRAQFQKELLHSIIHRHMAVHTCSVVGQFEAGFIFEAHVAERSDSTIYAHKFLPTLLWLYMPLRASWWLTTPWTKYLGDWRRRIDSIAVSVFVVILVEFDKYWVTQPERHSKCLKSTEDKVKRPKGTPAWRAPDFYIVYLYKMFIHMAGPAGSWLMPCIASGGRGRKSSNISNGWW